MKDISNLECLDFCVQNCIPIIETDALISYVNILKQPALQTACWLYRSSSSQ